MARYTVWSVGRDGNVEELVEHDSPSEALRSKRRLMLLYRSAKLRRKVGITDNEYPESGDVTEKLEAGE